ncbi:homeobox protein Hox-A2 [Striga asiatica]|uniref:Homeobox protein Hox-A2 n=1 Tax=Striga asiatica TaxID=4170 RepID=A0A5A7R9U3_STRAF|nr:homeobox protein Hox-A2 [Striga asiatica]
MPDSAFSTFGQPSLAHLLLHFSPFSLSPQSLLSLPFASTVPSLSPVSHLVVTSGQPEQISINNVEFSDTPIFYDGFVFVYTIDGRARFAAEINYFSAHRRSNHLGSGDYREFEMIPGFAVLVVPLFYSSANRYVFFCQMRREVKMETRRSEKASNKKAMEDIGVKRLWSTLVELFYWFRRMGIGSKYMNFMDFAREAAEAMSLAASSVEQQQTTYGAVDTTSVQGKHEVYI